jgi:hypothetical protein
MNPSSGHKQAVTRDEMFGVSKVPLCRVCKSGFSVLAINNKNVVIVYEVYGLRRKDQW